MPFDEAEFSMQASRIIQRHAGTNTEEKFEPTPSWLLLTLEIHKITFPMLDKNEPPAWVQNLFAELGSCIGANAAEFSDYYLAMLLKPFNPLVSFANHGARLNAAQFARLREYLGIPTDAAEEIILRSIDDDETRLEQSGY